RCGCGCGCSCCVCRIFPIAMIVLMLVWSYHVIVIQICLKRVKDYVVMGILLLLFHVLLCMFLWTWIKCIITYPAAIPDQWKMTEEDMNRMKRAFDIDDKARILNSLSRNLPIVMCSHEGLVRSCQICGIIKPDRVHHCGSCGTCVMKMDHHCPWIMNCVHFHNTKFFVLFLAYAELFLFYVLVVMFIYLGRLEDADYNILRILEKDIWLCLQFVVILIFNVAVPIMLLVSWTQMAKNRTTMESVHAPFFLDGGENKNGFNLGVKRNFREVFGGKRLLWPIPVFSTPGNGITYPLPEGNLKKVHVVGQRKSNPENKVKFAK
ncbi:hypothetical protein KR009_007675, partial [Drosophila setifemur]